jgi:hypothetical protein
VDVPTQSSGAEEQDQYREARAYNFSIYLMVGMPYLLLGVFGFMVYRGLKQKALAESRAAVQAPDAQGDRSCPGPSVAAVSSPAP